MSFDVKKELFDHIRYFMDISDYGVLLNKEIEDKIPEIIEKEEPLVDDFSYLERARFDLSILQMDLTKSASRIRLLYQISISDNIDMDLPDEFKRVLDSIVSNNTFDFAFCKEGNRMVFRDKEFDEFVGESCKKMFSEESLKEMQQSLKESFNGYSLRKKKMEDGNKKTNTV